jgi:REP element-mobilizing transposase RayT
MAHTYTNLLIHSLFSTKDRQPLIRPEMKSDLYAYMGGIITHLRGKPVLINGPNDHVHLLFSFPRPFPSLTSWRNSRPTHQSGSMMAR